MEKKYYITTPLYYVNALPHIGHAYTTICADALARLKRNQLGEDNVWLLTGTDEHGQKIQKAAQEQGLEPKEFADKVSAEFRRMWQQFGITYNDFIRTTEERHARTVRRALELLHERGDIYESSYQGCYCAPCESFWTESQVTQESCPDCKRPVEHISEKNFFFKISRYQKWLISHIEAHPEFIRPQIRYNEVLSFLKLNTLTDLCISRPRERLSWGIPVPFSPGHVTYVWFDALLNYISAVGEFDNEGKYRSDIWPADIQLIGKDILRQHAVYWPIMLKALEIEPPRCVFAHGWWLMGDTKMSKSLGNVVAPLDMAKKYGNDVFRYFLLRDVPFGADGNFSEEAIIKRLNSDLANDLGNLVYRTLTMVEKYYEGHVPETRGALTGEAARIMAAAGELAGAARSLFGPLEDFSFNRFLEQVWALVKMANKYVEDTKPWNLAKENRLDELRQFIRLLVDVIRVVAASVAPFIPSTAESMQQQIGGDQVKKGLPLFPRIEKPARE